MVQRMCPIYCLDLLFTLLVTTILEDSDHHVSTKTKILGIPDSRIILLSTSLHIIYGVHLASRRFRDTEYNYRLWDFRVEVDDEIRDVAYNASF